VQDVERDEDCEHDDSDERGFEPQMARRPEEVDAAQEADEQRRIAERRERTADIGTLGPHAEERRSANRAHTFPRIWLRCDASRSMRAVLILRDARRRVRVR